MMFSMILWDRVSLPAFEQFKQYASKFGKVVSTAHTILSKK